MQSYDPTECTIVFNGITVDGYAPGTFIKVSRNQDTWTYQPSNSGIGARSRNPDKSGRYEFTLLNSSPANALLSTVMVEDEQSATGVGECQVKDRGTLNAKCNSESAWVVKPPDWERAKELGEITWVIEAPEVDIFHDGLIDA